MKGVPPPANVKMPTPDAGRVVAGPEGAGYTPGARGTHSTRQPESMMQNQVGLPDPPKDWGVMFLTTLSSSTWPVSEKAISLTECPPVTLLR